MAYINFKQAALGSYLDRRNPPWKKQKSLGAYQTTAASTQDGFQFQHDRYTPQKDRLEEGSVLEEWIPRQPTNLHMMLRKIYLRDAIAGTVVDLFSTLPWGKIYDLWGIEDKEVKKMYLDMIETLGIWQELPMLCREYQVIGRVVGSLTFNSRLGLWDNLIPIDPDQVRIQPVPISGHKPLIDVLTQPSWREFSRSIDPRIIEIKENMNPATIQLLQNQSGYFPLDPLNTLWLARRVNHYDHIGTSLFTRILPAWAYETALWNASLIGVRRRNRSILLITAGNNENWEPNDEEIASLVSLFAQTDEDPTGGIVAVRNDVEVAEVRDPTQIWGISQEFEFLSTVKMRALGVSEAYLNGETNVSNMETARSALGKNIASFRDYMIQQIFHKQLFPTFARIHNFRKRTHAEMTNNIRINGHEKAYITAKTALKVPESNLLLPTLMTEDTLRPEQDAAFLEMLGALADRGLPIPMRLWAQAAGFDLDKALAMLPEDAILKQRIKQLGGGGTGAGKGSEGLEGLESGGGGGGESESPPGGTADQLMGGQENAQSGGGDMLPPRWTSTSASVLERVRRDYDRPANSGVVRALASLEPRILAELQLPQDRILVPYRD